MFAQATTPVKAMRLYSGADGQTHAEEVDIAKLGTTQADILKAASVRFATRGAGTSDDWHTAPGRQYLITLKGHAEIEVGGGQIVHATTGSVLLIEDMTGKGHRAKVTADSEWHVMFVPLAK
jgi:quercetin dioxygenase-like cupin family protein